MQNFTGNGNAFDQLGTALMRASGILSALTACQDQGRGTFAVDGPFVLQAILALEGFVNDARSAYIDMCTTNEALRLRQNPAEPAVRRAPVPPPVEPADPSVFVTAELPPTQAPLPDLYEIRRTAQSLVNSIARDTVLSASQDAAHGAAVEHMPHTEEFALSYDALLRKLTAAEVFAAEQGHAETDRPSPLLPLLKSLRHDLERIRAA